MKKLYKKESKPELNREFFKIGRPKKLDYKRPSFKANRDGSIFDEDTGKIFPQHFNDKGYLNISWYDGKKIIKEYAHRIIAKQFILNPDNKREVNHKNGIKNDNRVENLEWVTTGENLRHSFKTGLRNNHIGKNNPNYKGKKNYKKMKVKKEFSREFFSACGKKAGALNKKKGKGYFSNLGKLGALARWGNKK